MKEPILEPLLRKLRIGRVISEIEGVPNCHLLDVGCGFNHKFLSTIEPFIEHGTGIDFKVPEMKSEKLTTLQVTLDNSLPLPDESYDVVTMLAVLEHLDDPDGICLEISRVLKPGGKLVLTVPGKKAKPVLEFLSYKLGIVNRAEIEDHKKYFDLEELQELFESIPTLDIEKHKHFQLGMNNFCVIRKTSS